MIHYDMSFIAYVKYFFYYLFATVLFDFGFYKSIVNDTTPPLWAGRGARRFGVDSPKGSGMGSG